MESIIWRFLMGIKELRNFIFQAEKSTPSHISFRILGIKMHFLRASIKRERKNFAKFFSIKAKCNATDVSLLLVFIHIHGSYLLSLWRALMDFWVLHSSFLTLNMV